MVGMDMNLSEFRQKIQRNKSSDGIDIEFITLDIYKNKTNKGKVESRVRLDFLLTPGS
jgi:hypothetical protein